MKKIPNLYDLAVYFAFAAALTYLAFVEPLSRRYGFGGLLQLGFSLAGAVIIFLMVFLCTLISRRIRPKKLYRLSVHTFAELGPVYIKKLEGICGVRLNRQDSGKQVLIFTLWSRNEETVGRRRQLSMEEGQVKEVFYRVVATPPTK